LGILKIWSLVLLVHQFGNGIPRKVHGVGAVWLCARLPKVLVSLVSKAWQACVFNVEKAMFPWMWLYAPQLHFPFSGHVQQQIRPELEWFFKGIHPQSGKAELEQKAFEIASYGRQLGLITEVLIDLAGQIPMQTPEGQVALKRLQAIAAQINHLK
jgi:hypothetical protein